MSNQRFQQICCSQCGGEFGPGDSGFSHCSDHASVKGARDAAWWTLVMGAVAGIEDAAYCLRDEDAKRAAEGAANHCRASAKKLWAGPKHDR